MCLEKGERGWDSVPHGCIYRGHFEDRPREVFGMDREEL